MGQVNELGSWYEICHRPLSRLGERIGLSLCSLKDINRLLSFTLVNLTRNRHFAIELVLEFGKRGVVIDYRMFVFVAQCREGIWLTDVAKVG